MTVDSTASEAPDAAAPIKGELRSDWTTAPSWHGAHTHSYTKAEAWDDRIGARQ